MDKKNILITYDVPDWAYHKNAKVLKKFLNPEKYDIDIVSDQNKNDIIKFLSVKKYDMLFLQWVPDLEIFTKYIKFPEGYNCKVVSQVTSEVFFRMYNKGWREYQSAPLLVTKSQQYFKKLESVYDTNKIRLAYHVNDYNLFSPFELGKSHRLFKKDKSKFRVGYVGRDCAIANENKGHFFIRDACKLLGDKVEYVVAGFDNRLTYNDMPDFYKSLDVVVCASNHEGAPNSMLEAGLCGVPIITTRVGQIQEMIEDNTSGLFCERNALSIKEKIEKLMYNEDLYDRISINIGNISKEWALKAIDQWECFFDEVLKIE
jgi:glycosyltransferase involved in cell wall biosynthesis